MKKFIVLFLFDVYLFAFSQPIQLAHFIILYNVVYPDARCIVFPFYYYCCCCCVGLPRHVGQQTRKEIVYIRDAIVMIGWTITEILYISWLICLYVWMVWRIMQSKVNQLIRIVRERSSKWQKRENVWRSLSNFIVSMLGSTVPCIPFVLLTKRFRRRSASRRMLFREKSKRTHRVYVQKKQRTKLTTALRVERLNSIQKKQ